MANIQQRAVIKFLVKDGQSVTDIQARLKNVYGEASPSASSIRKWTGEFKKGRTSIEDDPRAGRPKTVTTQNNVEKLETIIRSDRRIREGDIGYILSFTKSTVHHILTKVLMMKKFTSKWVPNTLTSEQKLKRLRACESNLQLFDKNPEDFLNRYLAFDETWVHYSAPDDLKASEEQDNNEEDDSNSNDGPEQPSAKKVRRRPPHLAGKVRLAMFWNFTDGLLLLDFPEHPKMSPHADNQHHAGLLNALCSKLIENGHNLEYKRFIFHQDCMADEKPLLSKQHVLHYDLLEQPPYSPDLFPSDFYLDLNLKKFLVAKRFSSDNELILALKSYFNSLTPNYFKEGILALRRRYEKCIVSGGDYID